MLLELTPPQQKALDGADSLLRVMDPRTLTQYVLLPVDTYDRMQSLLYDGSDWTDDELRVQLARSAAANGWDEPGMEAYDRLISHLPQPS